jgi:hypothetical protein
VDILRPWGPGGETAWRTGDPNQMSAPIDIAGLVEIVGKRDLLAASIT